MYVSNRGRSRGKRACGDVRGYHGGGSESLKVVVQVGGWERGQLMRGEKIAASVEKVTDNGQMQWTVGSAGEIDWMGEGRIELRLARQLQTAR